MKRRAHSLSIDSGRFARTGGQWIRARCQCGLQLLHARGLNEKQIGDASMRARMRHREHVAKAGGRP